MITESSKAARHLTKAWLGTIILCALFCLWRILLANSPAFNSDIMALLPPGSLNQVTQAETDTDASGHHFVLLVDGTTKQRHIASLSHSLARIESLSLTNQQLELSEVSAFYRPFTHQLLSPHTRIRLQTSSQEDLAREILQSLYNPVGQYRPFFFAQDPYNLSGRWLQSLAPKNYESDTASLRIRYDNSNWWVITARLDTSSHDAELQAHIKRVIDTFQNNHPRATLIRSGLIFHSAEARQLASKEMSTIGLGSLIGIFVLTILVFRSASSLLLIAAVLASSFIVAMCVCFIVFARVHLLTMVFGATLLGLAVDYCFHYLALTRSHKAENASLTLLWRGLLIGASSSVAAYLLQLLSPFPGLHEFAVFMAVGLIAASITVVVISSQFRTTATAHSLISAQLWRRVGEPFLQRIQALRTPVYATIAVLLAISLFALGSLPTNDSLRSLNSSSRQLLDEEKKIQQALSLPSPQRYFIIEAASPQEKLITIEKLTEKLRSAGIHSYPSPRFSSAALVPSLDQQRRDYQLVADSLYGKDGALHLVCVQLENDCSSWKNPPPFDEGLTPSQLPGEFSALSPFGQLEWSKLYLTGDLRLSDGLINQMSASGATYVDNIQAFSQTLGELRRSTLELLAAFLLIFTIFVIGLYRKQSVPLIASIAPCLALSLVLGANDGVSVFHVLALLLVLGLSVDTAIFYLELGLNIHTWLASSLSIATSTIAFGLLSLSEVPVLHYFGSVVTAGLLVSGIITPLLFAASGSLAKSEQP